MRSGRQSIELNAIVLRTVAYGDAHRIVELATNRTGRMCVIARGARASRRRFAGALDLFVSIRAQVQGNERSGWTLHAADVLTARLGIRRNLLAFQRANRVVETARMLMGEGESNPLSYDALVRSLDALDRGEQSAAAGVYVDLARAAGIVPETEHCAACGVSADAYAGLDPVAGGLVCARCRPGGCLPDAVVEGLRGATMQAPETADTVEEMLSDWIETLLGRTMRSRRVAIGA